MSLARRRSVKIRIPDVREPKVLRFVDDISGQHLAVGDLDFCRRKQEIFKIYLTGVPTEIVSIETFRAQSINPIV